MSEEITAAAVLALFEKYQKKYEQHPDEFWCGSVACALRVVRDRRPPPSPKQPAAVISARKFLEEVPAMQAELAREASMYSMIKTDCDGTDQEVLIDGRRHDLAQAALEALDEARAGMAHALEAWEARDVLFIKDRDPAEFICAQAQAAWASTGGDVPKAINGKDRLCKFVADALALTNIRVGQGKTKGQPYSADAVSAILRGKNKGLNFTRGE